MFDKDPRLSSPEYKKLSPEQKAMVKLEITLTNFAREFNASVARWERIVYPAVFVLGLLAMSGFYLIYHVTEDMHVMATRFDPNMEGHLESMTKDIFALTTNISVMTGHMVDITEKMDSMDNNIADMNSNIGALSKSVAHMNESVAQMNGNMQVMTYTVTDMNNVMKTMTVNTGIMSRDIHRIQKPMKFFDNFTP